MLTLALSLAACGVADSSRPAADPSFAPLATIAAPVPAYPEPVTWPAPLPTGYPPQANATELAGSACGGGVSPAPTAGYRVIADYPHDPGAYTQGLVAVGDVLFESTGNYGQSTLRKVDLASGTVIISRTIAAEYFAEGLALFDGRLIQLTWQSHIGFVYDAATFEPGGQFEIPTEGWGLTHDGEQLIMSDGSAMLYSLDPTTFQRVGQVAVTDGGRPVARLNELEYVDGEVWANVWQTDCVARISPADGRVLGWIDLSGLLSSEDRQQPVDVLNGIAFEQQSRRLFVTGKWWPKVFEIEIVD